MPRHHYTPEELNRHALADMLNDARQAEEQAANGPYFPEKGITAGSLKAYAERCRKSAKRHANGGAHAACLAGEI